MMIDQLKCRIVMYTLHLINAVSWIITLIWSDTGTKVGHTVTIIYMAKNSMTDYDIVHVSDNIDQG